MTEPATPQITTAAVAWVAVGATIILVAGVTMGAILGTAYGYIQCTGMDRELRGMHRDIETLKQWYKLDH